MSASLDLREIGGLFVIEATARPDGNLARVEKAVDEELRRFLSSGPTPAELRRVKTQYRAGFIRGVERIGGFGGKSDVLAQGEVFAGRPDFYQVRLQRVQHATPQQLLSSARQWLSDGVYSLEVQPYAEFQTAKAGADRSKLPDLGAPPDTKFPALERATLSNGLKIVLARRASIPQVRFDLLLDAGFAADQSAIPGTASLAMAMLDEGTTQRNALQISDQLAQLGANLSTGSRLDVSSVSLEALRETLDPSLAIYADVILHPSFPRPDFERLKKQRLAQIGQEKADPVGLALRVFPGLLYGKGHAYANPWTGSGTEESTARITREDLIRFHQDVVQAQPCHPGGGWGNHDGRDSPEAGTALRRLEAWRRAHQVHRRGGPAAQAGGLPDRPTRLVAVAYHCGERRATQGESPRKSAFKP